MWLTWLIVVDTVGISFLLQKDQGESRCLQQRRQSGHFRQWSRRLLSQCSQVLTSFWNDPTWPNYPLGLPLATLQLVRLKTSPASNVTSKQMFHFNKYTALLQVLHMQSCHLHFPSCQHDFACVLAHSSRFLCCSRLSCPNSSQTAIWLYLHRCRQYKRTKSVSRNWKSWAYQH